MINIHVYNDLHTRSYLQGHGHSVFIPKICVWVIIPQCHFRSESHFTQPLSMTEGCVITLTLRHVSKVKVTVHTYPKLASWPKFFTVKLDGDGDDLIVVYDTGVVVPGVFVQLGHVTFFFNVIMNFLHMSSPFFLSFFFINTFLLFAVFFVLTHLV